MNLELRTESVLYIGLVDCTLIDPARNVYYSAALGETISLNADGETCLVVRH